MYNYIEEDKIDIAELKNVKEGLEELRDMVIDYIKDENDLYQIDQGLEKADRFLKILEIDNKEELELYLTLNDISYGTEDADSIVEAAKKGIKALLKFVLGLIDRIIKFITSFFNKGMTLTEKLYISALIRKKESLERAIDNKKLNKNKPLDIKDKVIKKILRHKDLFVLEAIKEGGVIDPNNVIDYVRGTLTLFTDNMVTYDNTCDTLVNMVKDIEKSNVTNNTLVGFVSERNRYLITTLNPLKRMFNRNPILKELVNKITEKHREEGSETFVIPLPLKGKENNEMVGIVVIIKKPDIIANMKPEELKNTETVLKTVEERLKYEDLGIDINRLDHIKVKSASFTEIDNIVTAFKDASEKIKKKFNPDKITKKMEKLGKKLNLINKEGFDSKSIAFKTHYIVTGLKLSTALLESSKDLYRSGYCDSIKEYILNHTL